MVVESFFPVPTGPCRMYVPTLPACSIAVRPIKANRVGGIRGGFLCGVGVNISPEGAHGAAERATVSLACRRRNRTATRRSVLGGLRRQLAVFQHGVDDAVVLGFRGGQDLVAVGVLSDHRGIL